MSVLREGWLSVLIVAVTNLVRFKSSGKQCKRTSKLCWLLAVSWALGKCRVTNRYRYPGMKTCVLIYTCLKIVLVSHFSKL